MDSSGQKDFLFGLGRKFKGVGIGRFPLVSEAVEQRAATVRSSVDFHAFDQHSNAALRRIQLTWNGTEIFFNKVVFSPIHMSLSLAVVVLVRVNKQRETSNQNGEK